MKKPIDVFLFCAILRVRKESEKTMKIYMKKSGRPSSRPDKETLLDLYNNYTATAISKMYNVSIRTVRNWLHDYSKEEKENG